MWSTRSSSTSAKDAKPGDLRIPALVDASNDAHVPDRTLSHGRRGERAAEWSHHHLPEPFGNPRPADGARLHPSIGHMEHGEVGVFQGRYHRVPVSTVPRIPRGSAHSR